MQTVFSRGGSTFISVGRTVLTQAPKPKPGPRPAPAPKPAEKGTQTQSGQKKTLPSRWSVQSLLRADITHGSGAPGRSSLQRTPASKESLSSSTKLMLVQTLAAQLHVESDQSSSVRLSTGCAISFLSKVQASFVKEPEAGPTEAGEQQSSTDLSKARHSSPSESRQVLISSTPSDESELLLSPVKEDSSTTVGAGSDELTPQESTSTVSKESPAQKEKPVKISMSYKRPGKKLLEQLQGQLAGRSREERLSVMGEDWSVKGLGEQHPERERRVDSTRAYMMEADRADKHLMTFLSGTCAVTTTHHIKQHKLDQQLGHSEDGTLYVTTIDAILKIIKESGGSAKEFSARLGVDWDESWHIRINVIHNPLDHGLKMPAGNESSANWRFHFGGRTKPDNPKVESIPEAVLHKYVPKGDFTTMTISTFQQEYSVPEEQIEETFAN